MINGMIPLFRAAILSLFFVPAHAQAVVDTLHTSRKAKQFHLFPAIMHSPETNWGLGVSTVKLFQNGNARFSNMTGTAIYTFNNQILLDLSSTVFMDDEKWLLRGKTSYP